MSHTYISRLLLTSSTLLAFIGYVTSQAPGVCPSNQEWNPCIPWCYQEECYAVATPCAPPPDDYQCPAGCTCPYVLKMGFRGVCVPVDQCPDCPEGKEWVGGEYPEYNPEQRCERTCDNPFSNELCPQERGCKCPQDKVLHYNGSCVNPSDCYGTTTSTSTQRSTTRRNPYPNSIAASASWMTPTQSVVTFAILMIWMGTFFLL